MSTNLTYIETVLTSVVIHAGMYLVYLVNVHTDITRTKKKLINKVTIVTKENGADKLTKYGRPP